MSSTIGNKVKVTVFGQSHSNGTGVVIDGLPAGEEIDLERVQKFLSRRAPGKSRYVTPRKESDTPSVISGLVNSRTCGAPLCAVFSNSDTRSEDYAQHLEIPRPSHADYPAHVKYRGYNDIRGGGHFSGRLTAPLCFAGAVCLQILERKGVKIGAHLLSVGDATDSGFDPVSVDAALLDEIAQKQFPVIDDSAGKSMIGVIESAMADNDSVGGIIECCATGLPVGLGEPIFDGVENRLAAAIFGIPGVRGIEFGTGFAAAGMRGSEHNDAWVTDGDRVVTSTNHHGGIIGGLTTGMPIILRVAFKPTSSIGIRQRSVNLAENRNCDLTIHGRHDPCIAVRAVPVVEAAVAVTLLDIICS
ncbi:MAG: chorismate synthase [Clostridiales bacterium]|nr:chorismate synthase [Clostridiales bacterium]